MNKLTNWQFKILEFIRKRGKAGNKEIKKFAEKIFGEISRITIIKNVNVLVQNGLIKKIGKWREIYYQEVAENRKSECLAWE